jgi:hypothetical protein
MVSDFTSLDYDGAGNRLSFNANVPGTLLSGLTTYTYDSKDQLTSEVSTRDAGWNYGFGYDGAGNPTLFKGAVRSYNASNQDTAHTHDGNGNPTTYFSTALTYDPENRLTAVGTVFTAGYRGDGLRAWKQGSTGGKTYYLYDGTRPVLELDGTGAVLTVNSFGANGLTSRSGMFFLYDPQGTVAHRVDTVGNVSCNCLFEAHGAPRQHVHADPFGYKAQWGVLQGPGNGADPVYPPVL